MKILPLVLLSAALLSSLHAQAPPGAEMDVFYTLGPDSLPMDGVPKGEIKGPFVLPNSKSYPGTQHTYWVYVPAQYDPKEPARLMVFNDGQAYMNPDADIRAQNVMDNLIYRRELPVMLGVFINPGRRPDQPEPNLKEWGDRTTNRPEEYNSLDDRYARVIVDELLPALEKDYNISKNPDHRGIGGSSSGAIAAFTVAWERPNEFHKVLSMIGTFVDLRGRGGNKYPDMVRESPEEAVAGLFAGRPQRQPRATGRRRIQSRLRLVLEQRPAAKELTAKGYDVNYVWGIGRHSSKHGGSILPDMMRWLWRDHPVSTDEADMVERSFNKP
ncbi:MAG: alpha/beta hydrolase-fold protein [Bryobacterales bacterium]